MGTKRDPGEFDCYAAADEDEELFVLLGRDPDAAVAVRAWADARENRIRSGECPESDWQKVATARQTAWSMDAYRIKRAMDTRQASLAIETSPIASGLGVPAAMLAEDLVRPIDRVTGMIFTPATHPAAMCAAVRQGDELWCRSCGLRWGVDDHEPPVCPQGGSR